MAATGVSLLLWPRLGRLILGRERWVALQIAVELALRTLATRGFEFIITHRVRHPKPVAIRVAAVALRLVVSLRQSTPARCVHLAVATRQALQ